VHLASANLPEYQTGAHRHRNNLCVASFYNDVEQLVWLSFSWRGYDAPNSAAEDHKPLDPTEKSVTTLFEVC